MNVPLIQPTQPQQRVRPLGQTFRRLTGRSDCTDTIGIRRLSDVRLLRWEPTLSCPAKRERGMRAPGEALPVRNDGSFSASATAPTGARARCHIRHPGQIRWGFVSLAQRQRTRQLIESPRRRLCIHHRHTPPQRVPPGGSGAVTLRTVCNHRRRAPLQTRARSSGVWGAEGFHALGFEGGGCVCTHPVQ
jgi:hypothetical protein